MALDLRDAARFLGVDESTVHRWIRRGELAPRLVNERHEFDPFDLLEFAAARGIEVPPEMLATLDDRSGAMPHLTDAIRTGSVQRDVPGTDKASVLRAVVDRLPLPPRIDRALLHQMLLARERLGSTGLGKGVAIPHARNPLVLRVGAPAVAVSYLSTPVDFDAVDGQPVHTLFTVVSPSVRVHLHLLAVLAAALHDPEVQARIAARAGEAELVEAVSRVEAELATRRAASGRGTP